MQSQLSLKKLELWVNRASLFLKDRQTNISTGKDNLKYYKECSENKKNDF
jgi:hypothetical protein